MSVCPYCGHGEPVFDSHRGDSVCSNPACGEIIEERALVVETTFVETSSGGAAASGQKITWSGMGNSSGGQRTNYEVLMSRGNEKISFIADRLQLTQEVQKEGSRMYELAVRLNFNQGRPTRCVACACLYIVCRRKRSPHLLIDFSDVIQKPVKVLGQVYVRLLKRLVGGDPSCSAALVDFATSRFNPNELPIVDPSIFIYRFSNRMDLGSQQKRVRDTAARLIQFMHRDWICLGRRPNGICGAALLIAAYYHNLPCSSKDIADTVRMSEATLRQRLVEMQATPLALMNRTDFEKAPTNRILPLEDADARRALPPCMIRSKRQVERRAAIEDAVRRAAIEDAERRAPIEDGVHQFALEGEPRKAIEDGDVSSEPLAHSREHASQPEEQRSRSKKLPMPDDKPEEEHVVTGSGGAGSSCGADDAGSSSSRAIVPIDAKRAELYTSPHPTADDIESIARGITDALRGGGILETVDRSSGAGDIGFDDAATRSLDALLDSKRVVATTGERPTQDSESLAAPTASQGTLSCADEASDVASETLSDVDDKDLEDLYLLDEEEQQHKSDIWHEVNKDYLEEWHDRARESKRRQQEKAAASQDGASASSSKRSRRRYPTASSPQESAAIALTRKGKVGPNRIHLEMLNSLFD